MKKIFFFLFNVCCLKALKVAGKSHKKDKMSLFYAEGCTLRRRRFFHSSQKKSFFKIATERINSKENKSFFSFCRDYVGVSSLESQDDNLSKLQMTVYDQSSFPNDSTFYFFFTFLRNRQLLEICRKIPPAAYLVRQLRLPVLSTLRVGESHFIPLLFGLNNLTI